MRTRSAFFKPKWIFDIRQVDLPDPPPEYVLLKIHACSICGSDLLWAEQGIPGVEDFFPFGHELAGEVAAVGEDVTDVKVGDNAVFQTAVFCGRCDRCLNGRVDLCRSAGSVWDRRGLGFGEYMLAPARSLYTYHGLSPHAACLTEPAGVAYDLVKEADIAMGERVCLVGPGPIGLMALSLAKYRGAVDLTCIGNTPNSRRLEIASKVGARTIAHSGPLDELGELKGKFDHVLMTAPTSAIPSALKLLDYGGRMTFIGLAHGSPQITLNADEFHFRKLQLRASFASPALYFPAVVKLIKEGTIPVDLMVSHTFPLNSIEAAMQTARDERETVVKVVVEPEHNQ